jgi:hypothetical protein
MGELTLLLWEVCDSKLLSPQGGVEFYGIL